MEEILASIRQIIADEPSSDQPESTIEANPLVPQSHVSKPTEARSPLADRLSNVLKGGPLPPTSPLGSKRPLSFDQDLADMFDEEEPSNGSAVVAPKPDIRVPTGLSHPMASKPFVASVNKADDAKPVTGEGAAALPPQLSSSEPLAPPPPFGAAEKPAEVPPPTTFGFPPLRKTSFYPPQPKAPVAPSLSDANPAPSSAFPEPASGTAAPSLSEPVRADETPKPADDLGATIPNKPDGTAGAASPFGPEVKPASGPFVGAAPSPTTRAPDFGLDAGPQAQREAPETPASPFASAAPFAASPSFGASAPSSFASAQPAAPRSDLGAGSPSPFTASPRTIDADASPPFHAAPVPPAERAAAPRPTEPRSYPDPFAQSVRGAPGYGAEPRFAPEPGLSADAAHQALDALAQGLAASAAASAEPASPAIPLTPVFEPQPAPEVRPAAPSTLPAPVPSAGSMPVNRTLEDAVADMLRPMLQQWVADNMPRIIERALRTEVAKSVKPGNKPPGT